VALPVESTRRAPLISIAGGPVYRWSTKGFGAPDLMDAKALLAQLAPPWLLLPLIENSLSLAAPFEIHSVRGRFRGIRLDHRHLRRLQTGCGCF
jgi:hypothetical protein